MRATKKSAGSHQRRVLTRSSQQPPPPIPCAYCVGAAAGRAVGATATGIPPSPSPSLVGGAPLSTADSAAPPTDMALKQPGPRGRRFVPQSTGGGGEVSDRSAVGAGLKTRPRHSACRTSQPHVPHNIPATARHRGRLASTRAHCGKADGREQKGGRKSVLRVCGKSDSRTVRCAGQTNKPCLCLHGYMSRAWRDRVGTRRKERKRENK